MLKTAYIQIILCFWKEGR